MKKKNKKLKRNWRVLKKKLHHVQFREHLRMIIHTRNIVYNIDKHRRGADEKHVTRTYFGRRRPPNAR